MPSFKTLLVTTLLACTAAMLNGCSTVKHETPENTRETVRYTMLANAGRPPIAKISNPDSSEAKCPRNAVTSIDWRQASWQSISQTENPAAVAKAVDTMHIDLVSGLGLVKGNRQKRVTEILSALNQSGEKWEALVTDYTSGEEFALIWNKAKAGSNPHLHKFISDLKDPEKRKAYGSLHQKPGATKPTYYYDDMHFYGKIVPCRLDTVVFPQQPPNLSLAIRWTYENSE